MTSRFRVIATVAAAGAAAVLLAAWGSSYSKASTAGPTSGSTTASDSPAVAAAKAAFARYSKPQPGIKIPLLPRRPPANKTITIVTCQLPVCVDFTNATKQGALKLGWHVKYVVSDLTPEKFQATMNNVVQNPGDFVTYVPPVPNSFIAKQLAVLKKKGVKVIGISPAGDLPSATGVMQASVVGPPAYSAIGTLMGDAIVADGGATAKAVWITDPSIKALWGPMQAGVTHIVTNAGGSMDVLNVSLFDIGKTVPTQVVSYVQSHPDVKYLAFALADLTIGVPQALQSAGLSGNVKIISQAPRTANLEDIKSGAEWAQVGHEIATGGYRVVDQFARLAQGVPLNGGLRNPVGWLQIFTKANVPTDTSKVPQPYNVPQVFYHAWHVK